jgi:two-component system OmpR family response regulator
MSSSDLILIVDDDPHIREVVRFALQTAGFQTAEAADGREALSLFRQISPALLVLDIVMPEMDGTDVCRAIRAESTVPIVFLSSRDEEVDRIVGLELGGDDYVTKPFSPRELVARVKAVLRRTADKTEREKRSSGQAVQANFVQHNKLKLDLDRFEAYWGDRLVALTVTEFNIVRALLGYPGKVFTRDELMSKAYSVDTVVTDRTIDSHVRRVRQKFAKVGGDPVETVHGLGYKLGPCKETE